MIRFFMKGNSLANGSCYLMLSLLFLKNSQTNLFPKRKSTEKSETTSTPPSSNLSSRNRVLEVSHDVLHILCCWRYTISQYHLSINLWILFLNHPPPVPRTPNQRKVLINSFKLFNLQNQNYIRLL